MKKLFLIWSFVLIVVLSYSQATNVADLRIPDATTAFGQNLPIGTKVYDYDTGEYWVATAAVINTATLTTASGSFDKLNDSGTDSQDLSYNSGTHAIDITGGGSSAIIPLAVDDGATEGLASFSADDFTITAGNVVIDYANGQEATNAQDGFATGAHITAIEANTSIVADGDKGDITLSSSGTVWTIDGGVVTYAKIQNVVADERILGRVSGADGVVEELTKAQVLTMLNIADGAEVNLDQITEKFEEDDGTPTAHSLAQTAVTAQGCNVSVNGAMLDPALYTLTTSTIELDGPVLQYDVVVIRYSY